MPRYKGIGTATVVVVVLIILITGAISLVVLNSQPGASISQNASSTTSSVSSFAYSTTNSTTFAQGLDLTESVSASTIRTGENLSISISILNTLPSTYEINASNDWPFQGVPIGLWPTCDIGPSLEAVVLNGNYTLQDLQKVAYLFLGNTFCQGGMFVDHVIFQPRSDQANITGTSFANQTQALGPYRMALNFTTAGYWNLTSLAGKVDAPVIGGSQPAPPSYIAFSPGVYTVALDDEWGQAVIMHVMVVSGTTSASMSNASPSNPAISCLLGLLERRR
jgi:hypothetical protein